MIAELIQSQMGLEDGVVAIYNQKRNLKPKDGLYVDVAFLGATPYAANSKPVNNPSNPDIVEVQTVAQRELYQVDIFSRDDSARLRKIDVIFALTGVAAQMAGEKYSLRIANIPASFVDVSEIEGAARLNRYALTFAVLRSYSVARAAPTFSVFQNPPREILTNP